MRFRHTSSTAFSDRSDTLAAEHEMTFARVASLADPSGLFNASLDGGACTLRAIDYAIRTRNPRSAEIRNRQLQTDDPRT